jgi:transposase
MGWQRGQSYSEDLRARVLAAVDGGLAARAAAKLFQVSVLYIYKALIRRRRSGEVSASPRRGHRARKLSPAQEAALAARIDAQPDLTLAALQTWLLAEHGVRLSNGAMWSAVARLGLTFKKDAPGERARPSGCRGAAAHLAGGAAFRRSRQACLHRRDRRQHQDDPALRSCPARLQPKARQIRWTVETDRPQARDMPRETPVCGIRRHALQRAHDDRLNPHILDGSRRTRAGLIARAVEAMRDKAPAPLTDRRRIDLKPRRHVLVLRAFGARQHDPDPQGLCRAASSG